MAKEIRTVWEYSKNFDEKRCVAQIQNKETLEIWTCDYRETDLEAAVQLLKGVMKVQNLTPDDLVQLPPMHGFEDRTGYIDISMEHPNG